MAVIGLLVAAFIVHAGQGWTYYSASGQQYNSSGLTNYVVIPVDSKYGGDPYVTYINASCDKSGSAVQFYYSTNKSTEVDLTNSTVTLTVNNTNNLVAGDILVIEHLFESLTNASQTARQYELAYLATIVTTATKTNVGNTYTNYEWSITTAVAPTIAVTPGDNVYQMTKVGAPLIPIGVATNVAVGPSAGGVVSGRKNQPTLGILLGGTNAAINAVSVTWAQ